MVDKWRDPPEDSIISRDSAIVITYIIQQWLSIIYIFLNDIQK